MDQIDDILSFIKPRQSFPEELENVIVNKQKEYFIKYLSPVIKNITPENIPVLKKELKKIFFSMLYNPGETIGVVCGQSIGERTTQGTLNTFHSAGLDTGATSQTDSFHSIINAAKKTKSDTKYFFHASIYLKNPSVSLKETKNKCIKYLNSIEIEKITEEINFKNVILENYEENFFENFYEMKNPLEKNSFIKYSLKLWDIFFYKISRNEIIKSLEKFGEIYCIPYYLLPETATTINIYIKIKENIFKTIRKINSVSISGIPGITSHIFIQDQKTKEWRVDVKTNNIKEIFFNSDIFDVNKFTCSSMYEFYCNFGILATEKLIEKNCSEIIPDISPVHFRLLSIKMTRNGYLEPLTRYTMRKNTSPLTRASFEECFETFLKAAKYKEKENYKTVSASILSGKKPRIGTYQCDVLIDPKFYLR